MVNDASMEPQWTSNSIKNIETTMSKNITKNEASRSYMPEGTVGPGVPEDVRSSSGDSRSRFLLASHQHHHTNKHLANN